MTAPRPDEAVMPSRESIEAEIRPMSYDGADLTECVDRVIALFAPILAEKERLRIGCQKLSVRLHIAESALAAERERCANLCETESPNMPDREDHSAEYRDGYSDGSDAAAAYFAAAIRDGEKG